MASAANSGRPGWLPIWLIARRPRSARLLGTDALDLAVILAADTVAECDGFILGKPRDEARCPGDAHQAQRPRARVLTGVCLWPIGWRRRRLFASRLPSFAWIGLPTSSWMSTSTPGSGKAKRARLAIRIGWAGCILSRGASRTSWGCRWSFWRKCSGRWQRSRQASWEFGLSVRCVQFILPSALQKYES